MAIATSYTAFDGHTYKPGEEIPSLGSFIATRVNGKIRHYQGLSKDFYLLKAASKTEKYNDLETGSTALLLDTSEKYRFETADNEWYKVASASGGGGGGEGGVTNYTELNNLPRINNVELIGDKTLAELGIQPSGDYIDRFDMENYAQPKGDYLTEIPEELENKVSDNENNISDLQDDVGTLTKDLSDTNSTVAWLDKRAVVGQKNNTVTKPWYKFASISQDGDITITFKVTSTYSYGYFYFGILTATINLSKTNTAKLLWEYASNNINLENFVLAYNTNEKVAELWCKIDYGAEGWIFEVLNENSRDSHINKWTLYNQVSEGYADEPTPGYTQVPSTLMTLANPAASATKAEQDGKGNNIGDTYVKYTDGLKLISDYLFELSSPLTSKYNNNTASIRLSSEPISCEINLNKNGTIYKTYLFSESSFYSKDAASLGDSSRKWKDIYASNGVIQTSDVNAKTNINRLSIDKVRDFIMKLETVTYMMKNGTAGRTHWGLLSNDYEDGDTKILGIEGVLEELGWETEDFAGFIKSPHYDIEEYEDEETYYENEEYVDEDGEIQTRKVPKTRPVKKAREVLVEGKFDYALRYNEFIPALITMEQDHESRLGLAEYEVQKHEEEINSLKEQVGELTNEVEQLKSMLQQLLNQ